MLKQSLIYLLLSISVVVFAQFAHLMAIYADMLYTFINIKLTPIFKYGDVGVTIRKILLLVSIPVIITTLPSLCYRLVKGKNMPHLIALTWCLWLVVILSNILLH